MRWCLCWHSHFHRAVKVQTKTVGNVLIETFDVRRDVNFFS